MALRGEVWGGTLGLLLWAATASLTWSEWSTVAREQRSDMRLGAGWGGVAVAYLESCLRVASGGGHGGRQGSWPSLIHSWSMQ